MFYCQYLANLAQTFPTISASCEIGTVSGCRPAVNLSQMTEIYQPSQQQFFVERPQNLTVIEGESVTLRCKIGNLAGKVQWSTDGFAMGYDLATIRSYCPKCSPRGDITKGRRAGNACHNIIVSSDIIILSSQHYIQLPLFDSISISH